MRINLNEKERGLVDVTLKLKYLEILLKFSFPNIKYTNIHTISVSNDSSVSPSHLLSLFYDAFISVFLVFYFYNIGAYN